VTIVTEYSAFITGAQLRKTVLKNLKQNVLIVNLKTLTGIKNIMTRNQMIAKIALEIATQAIESGKYSVDLSWLDTEKLLETVEQDMKPMGKWEEEH
jgi:cell division inhibitor SulA